MYGNEDSFGPTFASALSTATYGYLMGTWFKKKPGSGLPMVADGVALVGGLGLRNRVHHAYGSAVLEGLGYGGAYGTGETVAANTKTLGSVGAQAIPRNRSSATTGSFAGNPGNPGAFVVNNMGQGAPWNPWYNQGYSA